MLIVEINRESNGDGGRFELRLRGASLPPPLEDYPVSFELVDCDPPDLTLDDFALPGIIHFAMERGEPVHVAGKISARLKHNLQDYQEYWRKCRPERYSVVDISADEVVTEAFSPFADSAVATYSGGIDSTYAIVRQRKGFAGADALPLGAVMIVHGFDVHLSDAAGFVRLRNRLAPVLADLGLHCYVVRTNLKRLNIQDWGDSHVTQLVSCLNLVSHCHGKALIAGTGTHDAEVWPWGLNPTCLPMLTSARMQVLYDAPGVMRTEKLIALKPFPKILSALKFCWENADAGRNCGRCQKCLSTYFGFRAAGIAHPDCFDAEMSDDLADDLDVSNRVDTARMRELLFYLREIEGTARIQEKIVSLVARYEQSLAQALIPQTITQPVSPVPSHALPASALP